MNSAVTDFDKYQYSLAHRLVSLALRASFRSARIRERVGDWVFDSGRNSGVAATNLLDEIEHCKHCLIGRRFDLILIILNGDRRATKKTTLLVLSCCNASWNANGINSASIGPSVPTRADLSKRVPKVAARHVSEL